MTKRVIYAEDALNNIARDKDYMSDVAYIHARAAVNAAPTVEPKKGRCKDCIHRHYVDIGDEIGTIGGCGLFGTPMMTCNDFCSYGERRTDDE